MYRISGSTAGWPHIRPFFSNPVPVPVPAKMVPRTRYLSRIVLGPFCAFTVSLQLCHREVINGHRAQLLPDNAEILIFLKYNV